MSARPIATAWALQSLKDPLQFFRGGQPLLRLYPNEGRARLAMRTSQWPDMAKEFTPVRVSIYLAI